MTHNSPSPPPTSAELLPVPGAPLLRTGLLLEADQAARLMQQLLAEIPWNSGAYQAFGRMFALPRLQTWFADPGVAYRYASHLQNSHPWSPTLQALRRQVEEACDSRFNAVLANCYRDGQDSVGWHADDEPDLGPAPTIASLSLGATRSFVWRRKDSPDTNWQLPLAAGILLVMDAPFQRDHEHAVLQDLEVTRPRINLTFRQVESR
jgi:alkylated DNA repair dioxygenase AlkB